MFGHGILVTSFDTPGSKITGLFLLFLLLSSSHLVGWGMLLFCRVDFCVLDLRLEIRHGGIILCSLIRTLRFARSLLAEDPGRVTGC